MCNLEIDLPFINDRPMPVCFVGGNESGKSTVVSTVVNGMVVTKAGVYDDAEVEEGKVYRLARPVPLGMDNTITKHFVEILRSGSR